MKNLRKTKDEPFAKPPKDWLALNEMIGEQVEVKKSPVKGMAGLKGVVVDETLNTFLIETPRGRKRVPKKNNEFFFAGKNELVNGSLLVARPEDRTKKAFLFLSKKKKSLEKKKKV